MSYNFYLVNEIHLRILKSSVRGTSDRPIIHHPTQSPSFNIMAQINPNKPKRILLGAHWDSRLIAEKDNERQDEPIPGADDGGSGVGS